MNFPAKDVLTVLLDAGAAFAPETREGFSTHLPMTLSALRGIGASDDRLRDFYVHYSPRLTARSRTPSAVAEAFDPWSLRLGQSNQFEAFAHTIERSLRRDGREQTLRLLLARLAPGVAAAAFHGLIRTAHGILANHDGEIALGLAYWASSYQELGGEAPQFDCADSVEVPEWLAQLRGFRSGRQIHGRSISGRMARWVKVSGFLAAADSLRLTSTTLQMLAHRAAALYAAGGDFVVLHVVTASYAYHLLGPYIVEIPNAMRHFTRAVAAALLASEAFDIPEGADSNSRLDVHWRDLFAGAIECDDEHVIKLVHACHSLSAQFDDNIFVAAAARAVSMAATRQ